MALRATILTEVHVGKIGSASPIRELRGGGFITGGVIVIPTDANSYLPLRQESDRELARRSISKAQPREGEFETITQ